MSNYLVFATGNKSKQVEIRSIIQQEMEKLKCSVNLQVIFIDLGDIPEIQSLHTHEVAIEKAKEAGKRLQQMEFTKDIGHDDNIFVLVDDTGLYAKTSPINKITYTGKGFPGALIKDFMKSIEGNANEGICGMFGGSMAHAEVTIGIYNICDGSSDSATESDYGQISITPLYNPEHESFGWDACFIPNEINGNINKNSKSYDMLSRKEKNTTSMRSKAIIKAFHKICNILTT